MDKLKDIIRQTIEVTQQFAELEQTKLEIAAAENLTALEGRLTDSKA